MADKQDLRKVCHIVSTTNAATFMIRVRYSATKDLPNGWREEAYTFVGDCYCDTFCTLSYDRRMIRLVLMVDSCTDPAPGRDQVTVSIVLLDKTGSPASTAIGIDEPPNKDWTGGIYALHARTDDVEANCVVDGYFAALCSVAVIEQWPPPASSLKELPELGQDLAKMMDKKDLTDVSFSVDGETFCAHRLVLAARSPVFRAELYGPMAESKMASITIKDMKASTFRYMLDYMYHGLLTSSESDDEQADHASTTVDYQHLLVAADIYALETLKQTCESALCEDRITVDNVCSTLELAETHMCSKLKAKCLDFLADDKNFKTVATSDEYLHLMQSSPSLLIQVRDTLRLS